MHPKDLVLSIEEELMELGFDPLKTAAAVQEHMAEEQGTTLLFVNSLCGCVGTGARLAIKKVLEKNSYQPEHLVTVFADVDEEAATEVFAYTKPYPLSSPAIALFKDGELVYFLERHQIKGTPPEVIAGALEEKLEAHC